MKLLDAFWPTPLAFNALKADSTATTPESTTLIFDMRADRQRRRKDNAMDRRIVRNKEMENTMHICGNMNMMFGYVPSDTPLYIHVTIAFA